MVEAWRGIPLVGATERQTELFSQLRVADGYLPTVEGAAARLRAVSSSYVHPIGDAAVRSLTTQLQGRCAILTCFSGPAGELMTQRGLSSPFGQPSWQPLPHHAMVMLRVERKQLVVFDPWFEAEGQPVPITATELARMWTGFVALFERGPSMD